MSNCSRDISSSLFPNTGFTIACSSHREPITRPTAFILSCRGNPFKPTQGITHLSQGPNFRFHVFTNPLDTNTLQGIHVPDRINYAITPPQHSLKPTANTCSLGQLKNEYVQERRDSDLPIECLHFPISHPFTERFWHQSKYFFALPDRLNDYLNTFFTRDTAPYQIHQKYDPFFLHFGLLHPTQMDVNNTNHKSNTVKMLHTMHNYLLYNTTSTELIQ